MKVLEQSVPVTWMDVARKLSDPEVRAIMREFGFLRARVSWQGLSLLRHTLDQGTTQGIDALEKIFPHRISYDPTGVILDDPKNTVLEIGIEESLVSDKYSPSFGVIDGVVDFDFEEAKLEENPTPVVAAFSVKGGTGRTTTAVSFATQWASSSAKSVLLVDADVEAPGISYLYESEAGEPTFSLEDLIVFAHSDVSAGYEETLKFSSQRLKSQSLAGGIVVLPLRRRIDDITSSSLKAEHLSTPDSPFGLTDILSKIASELGCAGVVVDVRAGLVPLGANLALDPRVKPIFVTSLSSQSIRGTLALLRFIAEEARRAQFGVKMPLLVINRVPLNYQLSGQADELIAPITNFLKQEVTDPAMDDVSAEEDIFSGSALLEPFVLAMVSENPDMQVATGTWSGFLKQLHLSGVQTALKEAVETWLTSEIEGEPSLPNELPTPPSEFNIEEGLKNLATFAESLISAESAGTHVPKPLVIRPFDELSRRFQSDLPIAVVEGAKGTGKTLAARYYIDCRDWQTLCREMIGVDGAAEALIVPVVGSIQASASYLTQCDLARDVASKSLNTEKPEPISTTVSRIKGLLERDHSEEEWVDIWLKSIAASCGFELKDADSAEEFLNYLRSNDLRVVALFEGIEELYDDPSPSLRKAFRALLVGLPMRLRSEVGRPLGCIVFSRRDTTEIAIRQNLDHFRREYGQYALSWSEDDVLELAAWIATKSGALPELWNNEFSKKSRNDKDNALDPLWGRKLGPNDKPGTRTREAYSSKWVIAVLSDLQGRLVPRDLVRLIANAARLNPAEEASGDLADRLLGPKSLRDAVAPTSAIKVTETVEEIPVLKPVFSKFTDHAEEVDVPINADDIATLDLTTHDLELLQRHGVIFGTTPPYEVPELFRRGLRLRHSGARYSVISLYEKARKGRERN